MKIREVIITVFFLLSVFVSTNNAFSATITLDFEDLQPGDRVRNQYAQAGVVFTGVGYYSGLIVTEGQYGTANFGNSSDKIVHAGERNEPTTMTFVDPVSGEPTTANNIHIRLGDGNPDAETFTVTAFNLQGGVIFEQTYTTTTEGVWVDIYENAASVKMTLNMPSASGVAFDDISYDICFSAYLNFEELQQGVRVRNQYQQLGVVFSGSSLYSGQVMTEGQYGTANFGNSPVKIVHAGERNKPTILTFIDPATGLPTTAKNIHILLGDGNTDAETFTVTAYDLQGSVIFNQTYTTYVEGVWVDFENNVASIKINLNWNSYSGVAFDDVSFSVCQ